MQLNGNLVLNALGLSQIENMHVEKISALPIFQASEEGRLVFNVTDNTMYINDGAAWVSTATGGDAAALQTEVDSIETSLGSFVDASGVFVGSALDTMASVTSSTSLLDALTQIDAAIQGSNAFSELVDVNLAGLANAAFVQFNSTSGKWEDVALVQSMVTDVTTTAAELNEINLSGLVAADYVKLKNVAATATEINLLSGVTATTIEINYIDGVTSSIQTQLDARQPLDSKLTSIAGLTPVQDQILVGAALAGTWELESGAAAQSSLGLVIGTDVQAYDADLLQLAGLTPLDSEFLVGNGGAEGARYSLESGATVRTSLGLGDIATLNSASFIRADGTSTVTADIPMANFKISGLASGTVSTDAATYGQLQSAVAGLSWKNSVIARTTALIADLSAVTVALEFDGITPVEGDRVLVADNASPDGVAAASDAYNGIYIVGVVTTGVAPLTRSTDFDSISPVDEINSAALFVEQGSTYADSGWTVTSTVATLDTDPVTFTQFNGASGITAGIGLGKTGNTLDVNMGAGIVALPSDEVGIDLFDNATSALILTGDGIARGELTGDGLHLLLDLTSNGKMVQSVNGLKVTTNTITEAELTASVAGGGLTGGNGIALAVASSAGTAGVAGTVTVNANDIAVDLGTSSTTAAPGNHIHAASVVTYDNVISSLVATNVKTAIDELDGRADNIESTAGTLQTEVDLIEAAVGLSSTGTYVTPIGTNYLDTTTALMGADVVLDTEIKAVNTRMDNSYFVFAGTASTSYIIAHGIGSQFCNVTVIETATLEQVIPNSVVFTDANNLTVAFTSSLDCTVIVMGLAPIV